MPRGVFLPSPRGDVFYSYTDYLRKRGLRRGQRAFRQTASQRKARRKALMDAKLVGRDRRGAGIKAKHFLEDAWKEVVGPDGVKAFDEQVGIVRKTFSDFVG
jgi:hypothetical protein